MRQRHPRKSELENVGDTGGVKGGVSFGGVGLANGRKSVE